MWNGEETLCDYGAGGAVVRMLERSARCRDVPDSHLRECSYSVTRVHITVVGVGTSNAAVAVDGADEEVGYGVGVFMGEGCIRVAPGTKLKERDPMRRIEDGFLSTWTGEVYNSMTACSAGGLELRGTAESMVPKR